MSGRLLVGLSGLCVVALVAPAQAAAGGASRVVDAPYEGPGGSTGVVVAYPTVLGIHGSEVLASPAVRERRLKVSVADTTGMAVRAVVYQVVGRSQAYRELTSFCGHSGSLTLASADPVHVVLLVGNGCSAASLPTTGSVRFTFSR